MEFSQELKSREVETLACELQLVLIYLYVCLSVYMCMCEYKYLWRSEEFIRTPVAGVADSCETLDIGNEPLQKQQMLLTTVPSMLLQVHIHKSNF